jgi:hypothetical protein
MALERRALLLVFGAQPLDRGVASDLRHAEVPERAGAEQRPAGDRRAVDDGRDVARVRLVERACERPGILGAPPAAAEAFRARGEVDPQSSAVAALEPVAQVGSGLARREMTDRAVAPSAASRRSPACSRT